MINYNDPKTIESLRSLYRAGDTEKRCFDRWAGLYGGYQKRNTVDGMLSIISALGVRSSQEEVVDFFKKLEGLGLGEYVPDELNHYPRLEWAVQNYTVGRVAAGKADKIEEVPKDSDTSDCKLMEVTFPIRPLEMIFASLRIPKDITKEEARRLSDFIKTIPIDSA